MRRRRKDLKIASPSSRSARRPRRVIVNLSVRQQRFRRLQILTGETHDCVLIGWRLSVGHCGQEIGNACTVASCFNLACQYVDNASLD